MVFQKRVNDLEKQFSGLQALVDTVGKLVEEIHQDDRIDMITKYTSKFEDNLKTAHLNAADALEKFEQNQVLTKNIDIRVRELERTRNTMTKDFQAASVAGKGLLPAPAPASASCPQTTPAPNFGMEPSTQPDPWSQFHGQPDAWQQSLAQPLQFQMHGQQGPSSPPGIRQENRWQRRAPTLGFSQSADSADAPSTPYPPAFAQNFSSPLGAAINTEPVGHMLETIPIEPFDTTTWKISAKDFPQDVPKFDGRTPTYRNRWNRLRDHISSCYQPWGRILDLVERSRVPCTFKFPSTYHTIDGADLDLVWLSKDLWCFLGPRLGDAVYSSRVQKAGGEGRNGLELWRKLFEEHEGGAEQVALAGLRRLHTFPQCPSRERLGLYLGEWSFLKTTYCGNLPDLSLWTMLMNVLPKDVQQGVRDRKSTLVTTQSVIDYLNGELARYQDSHLSKIQDRFETKILQQGAQNPARAVYDTKQLLKDKIQQRKTEHNDAVNAVTQAREGFEKGGKGGKGKGDGKGDGGKGSMLDRPDPKWPGGCWHCGEQHPGGRRQCISFRALIKKHGGLPKDYQGAYEFWAQQNKTGTAQVNALSEDQADLLQCVACVRLPAAGRPDGSAPAAAPEAPPTGPSPSPAAAPSQGDEHQETVKHTCWALLDYEGAFADMNIFHEIARDDSDYSDLVEAVSQTTSNINIGPRQGQKKKMGTRLSPQRIAAIAKDVQSVKMTLPELDPPLVRIVYPFGHWWIVEAPCTSSTPKRLFLQLLCSHRLQGTKGLQLPMAAELHTGVSSQQTSEPRKGNPEPSVGKNADVAMPILSTHELAKTGHTVEYDEDHGFIKDKQTCRTTNVIQQSGVYCIQRLVNINLTAKKDVVHFRRQG